MKNREEDIKSRAKRERLEWFLDKTKRGKWLADIFSSENTSCPSYAIVPGTGQVTYDPEKIKEIYFTEGTSVLKNKRPSPPPFEGKAQKPLPPPDYNKRRSEEEQIRPHMLPKWWSRMYDRQAKGIRIETWDPLMQPADWKEVLKTIMENGKDKAAGWDGMSFGAIARGGLN